MDKLKIRFYCDDIEETKEIEVDEEWTFSTIESELDDWIYDNVEPGYEILEMNGEPYKYD